MWKELQTLLNVSRSTEIGSKKVRYKVRHLIALQKIV